MKNYIFKATLFASALALLAGCAKELPTPVDNEPAGNETQPTVTCLGLNAEGYTPDTKTSVKDNTVVWVDGDEVRIRFINTYGSAPKTSSTLSVNITDDDKAYIQVPNTININDYDVIRACYPSAPFYDDMIYVTFPASYASSIDNNGRQVLALPMMAYADNSGDNVTTLELKHLTAAVKVMMWNATENPLTVTRVVVKTNRSILNGLVATNSTQPEKSIQAAVSYLESTAPQRQVEVTFPGYGQSGALVIPAGDQTKSVQVPFRPIGEGNMTIEIYLTDGTNRYVYSYTATNPTLTRNQMMTAKAKLDLSGNMVMTPPVDLSALDPSTFPTDYYSTPYYTVSDGDILTGTFPGNCNLCIPDGATVTLQGVTHHTGKYIDGIQCLGSATIILAPGTVNDLTRGNEYAYCGIGMTGDGACTLTIEGSGTLNVSGGQYAGIGGNSTSHHIVINGGIINATGGNNAPGIGASVNCSCGNITINGGTVNATGGQDAAGIGCGNYRSYCGNITFAGGTVTVTNGSGGCGVGDIDGSDNTCGNVYFTGGTVTVTGGIYVNRTLGASRIYVDGNDVGPIIPTSPYYYPAQ